MLILATIVGLVIAFGTLAPFSSAAIRDLTRTLGWPGFVAYVAYSLMVFGLLGGAWLTVMARQWTALPAFMWARMLREAASDLLPFSQIGGFVIGADALIVRGFPGPAVYASMTADLTTELASQAVFTLLAIGLFTSAWTEPAGFLPLSAAVTSVVVITLLVFAAGSAPRWIPAVAPVMLERLAPRSLANVNEMVERLRGMYAHRARVLGSAALNFLAWTMSAAGAWIVLLCMGSDFPLRRVLSLEAFIFALRSVAFMVPGGIGVQEAGYAIVAPLFGLPIEQAVVLAMIKRCKDLAIGLPTLIGWQLLEARKLSRAIREDVSRSTVRVGR